MDVVLDAGLSIACFVAFIFSPIFLLLTIFVILKGLFTGVWRGVIGILVIFIVLTTIWLAHVFVFSPNDPLSKDIKSYIPLMSSSAKAPQHKPDTKLSEKFKNSPLLKD